MNNRDIADLMRRARPTTASSFHEAGQDLLEEIMSTPTDAQQPKQPSQTDDDNVTDITPVALRKATSGRTRWAVTLAAAAAAVLAVAVPMTMFQGGGSVTPAAELPQESLKGSGNPYLLSDDDRWQITDLRQNATDDGEEIFTSSEGKELSVAWRPRESYQSFYDDRKAEYDLSKVTIFNTPATLFETGMVYEMMLPPVKGSFVSMRASNMENREEFLKAVEGLRQVDAQEWREALGDKIVAATDSKATAQNYLRGVPLPDGFDPAKLTSDHDYGRYDFAVEVLNSVSCAWLKDYRQAHAQRNEDGMAAVDAALSTNADWTLMKELEVPGDGGWGMNLVSFAGTVAAREDASDAQALFGC